MSFEGFYQIICENGHYSEIDCWDLKYVGGLDAWLCEDLVASNECKAKAVWDNLVDDTNFENDGFIVLDEITPKESCRHCGVVTGATFKIPEGK